MGPQYTSCVEAADFKKLDSTYLAVLGITAGAGLLIPGFAFLTSIAAVEAFRYILDWMLNGKLICLHRDNSKCNCNSASNTHVCAIGEVADTEDVGEDKNPIEDIDNDYAINLILAPNHPLEFTINGEDGGANQKLAEQGPQGDLIAEQPNMPGFGGYCRTLVVEQKTGNYEAWTSIVGKDYKNFSSSDQNDMWVDYLLKNAWLDPKKVKVPVLHCEIEGSRIHDMLSVINAFTFGGKWCKKNIVFKILCKVIQVLLSPIILAALLVALAIAWAAASDGRQKDALLDPKAGEVGPKDRIIITGRWAYDGGHSGYNEIHAVRTVQKIDNVPGPGAAFDAFLNRWCEHLEETPPGPDDKSQNPSPRQEEIRQRQEQPEHRWQFHPLIDGCRPRDEEDEDAPYTPPIIK